MKGLEVLEKLRQNNIDNSHLFDNELLDIVEKELKALEIIKNKRVDTCCEIHTTNDYNEYLELYEDCFNEEYILTQEEYNLLKEVFNA